MKLPRYTDMTAPYTSGQGFAYETWVAPAVMSTVADVEAKLFPSLRTGAHLLDVGAGAGKFAIALAEHRPDLRITGVDLSPHQVDRARAASAHLGDRVQFLVGSALDLPFVDASFAGILSCGSIKHWPDRARGIAEAVRVVEPGGPVVITEVDRSCRFEDTRDFVRRWPIPGVLAPVAYTLFRSWVAGQSLDLDDARALLATSALRDGIVARVPDSPLLMIAGRR